MPASAVDTSAVLSALGVERSEGVSISITVTTDVSPTVQVAIDNVMAANGGETYEISTFNRYVSRSVEITEEQAEKVTTAVVIEPDGTVRHVPAFVYEEDGKWYYAVVNSLINSTYALIRNEIAFADAAGKWYEAAVNEMASRMIISEISDTEFGGDLPITRAELAVLLVRALGLPEDGNGTVFNDVSASAWYAPGVYKAYEYGLVTGIGNGKYAPDKYATRQETMVMVRNAAKIAKLIGTTIDLNAFKDAGFASVWALEAAKWSVGTGLIVGSDGNLRPPDNITRAEAAVLVLKMLQEAGLIDVRTQTGAPKKAMAYTEVEPRKEPNPIEVPEDNDEEDTGPDGDGNDDGDDGVDTDGLTDGDGQLTPPQAIATLNRLLAH